MHSTLWLQSLPLFRALSPTQLEEMRSIMQTVSLQKGDVLFREGETAEAMYLIHSGRVRVFKALPGKSEQVLHIFTDASIIGEVPMFSGSRYPASAEAVTDSTLYRITRKDLLALIEKAPSIALLMLAIQAEKLKLLTKQIEQHTLKNPKQKIAHYLLTHRTVSETGIECCPIPGNLQQWAKLLNLPRETLSRTLSQWQQEGILEKNKTAIIIKQLSVLHAYQEGKSSAEDMA